MKDRTTIYYTVTGKPRMVNAKSAAKILGIDTSYFNRFDKYKAMKVEMPIYAKNKLGYEYPIGTAVLVDLKLAPDRHKDAVKKYFQS